MKKLKHYLVIALMVVSGGASPAWSDDSVEHPPYPEKGLKGTVKASRLPVPENPVLKTGMEIWDKNCRVCHGSGLAGAPKITGSRFWSPRIAKGLPVLFDNAKNGFSTMPARGGKDLSDEQVEAAVRYMVFYSGGEDVALEGL